MPYPLQWVGTSLRGFGLTRLRHSPRFWDLLREIEARESWSKNRIDAFQARQLQNMILHAYNTIQFYRERFDSAGVKPDDIRDVADLSRLPVLKRQDVQRRWRDMVSTAIPNSQKVMHRTSGTTGSGLTVVVDYLALQTITAYVTRQMRWAGIEPRDWRLTMFGARVVSPARSRPPYWAYNWPGHQLLLSGFHLSEQTVSDYIALLHRHQNWPLEGFATTLHILARLMAQVHRKVHLRALFSNGEPLYPHMRKEIEEQFGARIWDAYGQTELVGLIQECEMGKFHLAPDFGVLEIIDDAGGPAAHGQAGAFIWTGLVNYAMPLIRYQIGDVGEWDLDQTCSCGRETAIVHPVLTRDSDYLRAPNNNLYSPRMVNQLLKYTDFQACQFIQKSLLEVVIRYVPGNNNSINQAESVRNSLQTWLGSEMKIRIECAKSPIQRSGGKIPLIISQEKW